MFRSSVKRFLPVVLLLCMAAATAWAADYDSVMSRWRRSIMYEDDYGGQITVTATYYAGEYIEAMFQKEAEKNLWTSDELENYKYELLKALQLDEYIPIMLEFDNRGPSLHMAPFDSMATLWIGSKKYSPADYDKRLNFKLEGRAEGLVFFPKYDEKTGKPLLEGVNSIRLILNGAISPVSMGKNYEYIWDTAKDSGQALGEGIAVGRLEADRLIKRLQNLNADKAELEKQLQEKNDEIAKIEARLAELQSK